MLVELSTQLVHLTLQHLRVDWLYMSTCQVRLTTDCQCCAIRSHGWSQNVEFFFFLSTCTSCLVNRRELQWNLSIMDTLGTILSVLIKELGACPYFRGCLVYFSMQLGQQAVSSLETITYGIIAVWVVCKRNWVIIQSIIVQSMVGWGIKFYHTHN